MDMTKLALITVEHVRKFVQPALDAIVTRIDDIERRVGSLPIPQDGKDGIDGKSITAEDVLPIVERLVAEKVSEIPAPKDGKDIEPEVVRAIVDEAVSAIPKPADGKDGRDGVDGKSLTIDDVLPGLSEERKSLVDAIPPTKAGKDGQENRKSVG